MRKARRSGGDAAVEGQHKPPEPTKLEVGGDAQPLAPQGKINSPGERAVLGRLQDRRQELEDRNRELDMRESLIKAAENAWKPRSHELKEIEGTHQGGQRRARGSRGAALQRHRRHV